MAEFNRAEAAEHLRWAYGTNTGFVAVGLLNRDTGKMTHRFYQWPIQRGRLLTDIQSVVSSDKRVEVFYCPLLRDNRERSIENAPTNVRVVWADIDKPITDDQRERLIAWGARLIESGTTGNYHVYFKLNRELTAGEHRGINIALREWLGGDPKLVSSNALLRIPGTVNHKHTPATDVRVGVASRRTVDLTRLTGVLADVTGHAVNVHTEQVRPTRADKAWKKVKVGHLLRQGRIRSTVRMSTTAAIDRWGKRYHAVNGAVGDLVEYGLTDDQIHTLMDEFPAAVDKENDERGYDVHADVARILAKRFNGGAGGDGAERGSDIDGDGIFEAVVETGLSSDAWKIVQRKRADFEANQFIATERFISPPADVSWDAGYALANPPTEQKHLIDGIVGVDHNVIVTAQYKTGKTTFVVSNLLRSLTDGVPFLGERDVHITDDVRAGSGMGGLIAGHWNCEMTARELVDDYIRPAEFKQPDNLYVANLQGYGMNLLSDKGKEWAVEWLSTRGVKVWAIDSLARIARMAGVNENDNGEVMHLLTTIDEIKQQAGVPVCFVITHTGRAVMDEGSERARGATVVDDWPSARWIMTRDGALRYLAVDGRGVGMETTRLNFDEATRRMTLGTGGKEMNKFTSAIEVIQTLVRENEGVFNKNALARECQKAGVLGSNRTKVMECIKEAVDAGFVAEKPTGRGKERVYIMPVVADGGARARTLEMSNVRSRKQRVVR
jgi:hypothetical protein